MNDINYDFNLFQKKEDGKKRIKRVGTVSGLCVLGYLLIQELLSIPLVFSDLYNLYTSNSLFRESVGFIITAVSLIVPFSVAAHFLKKDMSYDILPAGKAKHPLLALLSIPAGVALCLLASYVTAIFNALVSVFGIEFTMPDITMPDGGYSFFIYIMRLTVGAALFEEFCFRGVVLQSLRKYGNWFAILMSAVIFGLVHCNLVQAPFAIIAGAVIGYFAVSTGTVWTGIAIHMLNNGISALMSWLYTVIPGESADSVASGIIYFVMVIGLLCGILLYMNRDKMHTEFITDKHREEAVILTTGEKLKAFFGNIPMVLAIIAICSYTMNYINIK